MKKLMKRLSWIMIMTLVVTMLSVVPVCVEVKAASATMLYIKDTPGAETQTITEDTDLVLTKGWSWESETATLTLNGFNGEYIEADGDINIVLDGENQITLPADITSEVAGINVSSGGVTVVGNGDEERDSLYVGQTAFESSFYAAHGIKAYGGITIKDCDVAIEIAGDTSSVDKGSTSCYGIWQNGGNFYVQGNASLDINIAGTKICSAVNSLVYAQTTGNIRLRVYDSDTTDDWVPSYAKGVYGLYASGSGTVFIDAPDGIAIDGKLIVEETSGNIDLNGKVKIGKYADLLGRKDMYYLAPNKKISQTESGKETVPCCLAYDYFNGSNDKMGVWLMDGEKNFVKQARISTVADNPLTLVDTTAVDIEAREVGAFSSYIYLTGLVSGGSGSYTYSFADASAVPDYLTIKTSNSYIGYMVAGTPQKEYPAGTARIVVTDSLGETAYIDINYGEVTNPPKNITVDGETFKENESASGTNWSYDATTKKMSLNGYHGDVISSETDINLVLSGDNQITLPATPSEEVYGLKSESKITIAGDGDASADTLTIIQTGMTKAQDVYAIYAEGNLTLQDCTVSVNVKAVEPSVDKATSQRYGIFQNGGNVYVTENASLNINMAATKISSAVESSVYAQTTGTIQLRVYDSDTTDDWVSSYVKGVHGLYASGNGTVFIDVPDGIAIDGKLNVEETSGTIDLNGKVKIGKYADLLGRKDMYYLAPNKKISQTESGKETVPCCLAYDYFNGSNDKMGVWLMDGEKNFVKQARISTVADNPLTFVDTTAVDIEAREVGDSSSYIYLTGLVSGGSGTYTYSFADDSAVPDYLSIKTDGNNYIGYMLAGTPQKEYPAGTARIVVTDSLGATAYIDINYGAVTVANPVTSVSLDADEKILNIGETTELEVVLTPVDATISEITWKSSDDTIAYVDSEGGIKANSPGVCTVTVITVQGGLKDTCIIYVKEAKPLATVGETYIENLVANASYTVDGNSMTADVYGKIEIEDTWRDKTVEVFKTNAEQKCNSEAQFLYIPEKEAVNIAGFSALATLEYMETPYNGTAKEPDVFVEGLVKDTDYIVEYESNIDSGSAKAIITGIGDYFGTFTKIFKITPIQMTGITVSGYSGVYDKMGHTFALSGLPAGAVVTYSLEQDGIFSGEKPARVEVGETIVYFKVSAKNYEDYYGSTKVTVLPISIEGRVVSMSADVFVYDGTSKTPAVQIQNLVSGSDYSVAYANNVNVGTAKAIVSGQGNYTGTIVKEFTITPASIEGKTVTLSQTTYTYDGTAKAPIVSVQGLEQDVDYVVTYSNNVDVGTATVTVIGKNNYTGAITKTFVIEEVVVQPEKPEEPNGPEVPTGTGTSEEPKLPDKNTILKDAKTGIQYKVTATSLAKATVEFVKPKSKKVKKVKIPDAITMDGVTYKVTSIAKNAFNGCSNMTSVTIGKNVTTIGDKAFYKCTKLTKITIPSNVNKIGKQAFYGCKKLKTITIKTTKLTSKKVGSKAFTGTPKNAKVIVPKKSLKSYKKFLYSKGLNKKAKISK